MLKVGLIGCGFMGTMHASCYKIIDGVELVAVADVRPGYAEKCAEGTGATVYSDGMNLINNADVDIIDICLPTFLHAKYALAAMDKVKYLFVEKPITLTAEESDELIAKAKATGCQVQVGQVVRFENEYAPLTRIVREGKYGKVISANLRRLSPSPDWGFENWLHTVGRSGGCAMDMHIHDTDYALYLFGKPEKMFSVTNKLGEEKSYINTLMVYPETVVTLEGTWALPYERPFEASYRVVFENATLEYVGDKITLYADGKATDVEIKRIAMEGDAGGNVSDLGGYYNELVYFTDKAKAGEPIDEATLESATESLKFLLGEIGGAY